MAFVRDGGYEREELWSAEGWNWVQFRQSKHPVFWVCERGAFFRFRFVLFVCLAESTNVHAIVLNNGSRGVVSYAGSRRSIFSFVGIRGVRTSASIQGIDLRALWLRQVEAYLRDIDRAGPAFAWAMARRRPNEYRHKVDALLRHMPLHLT